MRCPDCNKFVPNGDMEVESQSVDLDGSEVTISVRGVIPCGECGTELKSYEFEVTESFEIDHDANCPTQLDADHEDFVGEDNEIEDDGEPEATERYEDKDRHGKPIKNARYQKHLYGFTQIVTVKCVHCDATAEVVLQDEASASDFEEC